MIISDGLSEQKNRFDIMKRTRTPQRHHSSWTRHLGLNLLPFKISSLHSQAAAHWFHQVVSEASKTAWFMKSRRSALAGSIRKSRNANYSYQERRLRRKMMWKLFRWDRTQSLCQQILPLQALPKPDFHSSHDIFSCNRLPVQLNIKMESEGWKQPFLCTGF